MTPLRSQKRPSKGSSSGPTRNSQKVSLNLRQSTRKMKDLTENNWSAAAISGCLIKHREDSNYLLSLFINSNFTLRQQYFHFLSTALSLFINNTISFHQQHFHFSSAVLSINSTFTFHQLRTVVVIFFCYIRSL